MKHDFDVCRYWQLSLRDRVEQIEHWAQRLKENVSKHLDEDGDIESVFSNLRCIRHQLEGIEDDWEVFQISQGDRE